VLHRHAGGYELYRRLREQREAEALAARPAPGKARGGGGEPKPAAGGRRLSYRERKELDGMESAILAAEAEKEAAAARLADPSLYSAGASEVAAATAAFRAASDRVDALYARWAELEELA
jgi:ABC transport system ATP-binding/permease protein